MGQIVRADQSVDLDDRDFGVHGNLFGCEEQPEPLQFFFRQTVGIDVDDIHLTSDDLFDLPADQLKTPSSKVGDDAYILCAFPFGIIRLPFVQHQCVIDSQIADVVRACTQLVKAIQFRQRNLRQLEGQRVFELDLLQIQIRVRNPEDQPVYQEKQVIFDFIKEGFFIDFDHDLIPYRFQHTGNDLSQNFFVFGIFAPFHVGGVPCVDRESKKRNFMVIQRNCKFLLQQLGIGDDICRVRLKVFVHRNFGIYRMPMRQPVYAYSQRLIKQFFRLLIQLVVPDESVKRILDFLVRQKSHLQQLEYFVNQDQAGAEFAALEGDAFVRDSDDFRIVFLQKLLQLFEVVVHRAPAYTHFFGEVSDIQVLLCTYQAVQQIRDPAFYFIEVLMDIVMKCVEYVRPLLSDDAYFGFILLLDF